MAKDKRLLICRSIIVHAQRLIAEKKLNQQQQERYSTAEDVSVWMEFTVPPKFLLADQQPSRNKQQQEQNSATGAVATTSTGAFTVEDKTFLLPHSVVARTGRGSVLFVANDVAFDAAKINKRYSLFDAVISLDSLIHDEKMGPKKASIAATTFSRFVFDDRVSQHPRLPRCLKQIALKIAPHQDQITVSILPSLVEERENNSLIFVLKQAGEGTKVELVDKQKSAGGDKGAAGAQTSTTNTTTTSGAVRVRIGHCGMHAGAITENGKEFLKSLRADFPQVARSIQVVNLTTSITRPIQWMELQISR